MPIIIECEQGTPEWHAARLGVITASNFGAVLAKGQGKTRRTYMLKLAGERITGQPADCYSNEHMERGREHEPIARGLYEERTGNQVISCGFMLEGSLGYSPDGMLFEGRGLLEIKSKLPHLQAELLLSGEVPSEHLPQIQGGLLVSGGDYLDFVSYCPGMPLFVRRVQRDESYIANLTNELSTFEAELQDTVKRITEKF